MPEIEIRPAIATDIHALMKLEHNYSSDHVWQMDFRQEDNEINIIFRQMQLPRSVQVRYPRDHQTLADNWTQRDGLLVAESEDEIVGYISLNHNTLLKTTWATDLAIMRRLRRQGIGSALILSAQDWAMKNKSHRLILEMQPKNYPAIQLANKLGFELCGYNDHYFANHDIALFFSKWLR
ncbi:MAG: GNAT family N-acetyltransferase [Anaerolineales bacterium]|jgi:ribosomal protein S18 acetylase RimI-like enzyme|nr:GNAT family N-acetyltransferase [Anaerolineales bacterium]